MIRSEVSECIPCACEFSHDADKFISGPVVSSYAVQDRVQVPDIDPSMLIEEVDDISDTQPCPICAESDNEDLLLLCDGCDVGSHTYCVGLDEVPSGAWYCEQCQTQRAIALSEQPQTSQNVFPRRTRGQRRRLREQAGSGFEWALVWQSIWDRLNMDLDFPFDDEQSASRVLDERRREASNRRDFQAWERRFQVAQRQGGSNRLGDLLEIGRGRPSRPRHIVATPEPESMDEVRAWNAFERAREIQNVAPAATRKRSLPASPASPREVEPAPERKLKRPRTRRPQDLAEAAEHAESSRAARLPPTTTATENTGAPSFLQSLLKEVEDSSTPNRSTGVYRHSTLHSNIPGDHTSAGPSSPALSPLPSNHSSPRLSATTPPPHSNGRALSPTPLTSTIEPIFPSPEFSPSRSPVNDRPTCTHARCVRIRGRELNEERERLRASRLSQASSPSRHLSDETSPSRTGLSLSAKSEVQNMVKMALKPHYREKVVDKDQYTDINRRISRMLYERVGAIETLNAEEKTKWETIATAEVSKAVSALQGENRHQPQPQQQRQQQQQQGSNDGD